VVREPCWYLGIGLGRGWNCAARRRGAFFALHAVSADLTLTRDLPAVDLSCTSRVGTDDGERSKGPVTWHARERTAVTTRIGEGSNQTQRMVTTRQLQCRAGSD
jgi:hypothetical protein